MLRRLGAGEPIVRLCEAAGLSPEQFQAWWQAEIRSRVPDMAGSRAVPGVRRSARIERDSVGIPHVFADNDEDQFFGFGYAQAQDRLFQLDYLRRRGSG